MTARCLVMASLMLASGLTFGAAVARAGEADLSNAPKIRVLYASAADQPDRFPTYEPILQQTLAAAADQVAVQSGGKVTVRFDRKSSAPDSFDIDRVRLPGPLSRYRLADAGLAYDRLRADLEPVLDAYPDDKVLVFADNTQATAVTGTGDTAGDSQPGPANLNNQFTRFAVVHGNSSAWFVAGGSDALTASLTPLHEVFHTLGAVQQDAPNTSADGTSHCRQRHDLMCYELPQYTIDCPRSVLQNYAIDCGGDDYFNATDPTGYLASHWNLVDSWFMVAPAQARTFTQAPAARLAVTPSARVDAGTTVTLDASASTDDQRVQRYLFDLDGDGRYETDNGLSATVQTVMDRPGTIRTVRVRAIDAAGAFGTAGVRITTTGPGGGTGVNFAPLASLGLVTQGVLLAGRTVTFSGSSSYDPEGGPLSFAWDHGADGTVEASGTEFHTVFPAPGMHSVRLTVTDDHALASTVTMTVTVAASDEGERDQPPPLTSSTFALSLARTSASQRRANVLKSGLKVRGSLGGPAKLRLTAKLGKRTLATGTVRVSRAGTWSRTLKLTAAGKRALRRAKRPARVTVTVRGTGVRTASRTVRLP